jgi:hypothetical protein
MNQALAHSSSGTEEFRAELHIDPADHPVVGQEAKFFFTFIDPEGKFEIEKCNCTFHLLKNEQEIESKPLFLSDSKFASFGTQPLYTKIFSEDGEYELLLEGEPKDGAVFKPFKLDFDIHVAQANGWSELHTEHHTMASQHLGHIIIFGAGFIAALGLYIYNYFEKKKKLNG